MFALEKAIWGRSRNSSTWSSPSAAKEHHPELVITVKIVNNSKKQMNLGETVWAHRAVWGWNHFTVGELEVVSLMEEPYSCS